MIGDHLDPHCPEQRYRLYRRRGRELTCVSACADEAHVVGMIKDQRDPEGGATLRDDDAVGILDAHGDRDENPLDEYGNYTLPGSWLIKPWVPGERPFYEGQCTATSVTTGKRCRKRALTQGLCDTHRRRLHPSG